MQKLKEQLFYHLLKLTQPLFVLLFQWSGRALKKIHSDLNPRIWSNSELSKIGIYFEGDVINVSGADDQDKQGKKYQDYFSKAKSYTVSNISGSRGLTGAKNEIFLDLTAPLEKELQQKFDTVFNHTVLEHVYDFEKAIENLCLLSRDVVVIVVPFIQPVHWEEGSFEDYWRFTPFTFIKAFSKYGFELLLCESNTNPIHNTYLFVVASKNPKKWQSLFNSKMRNDWLQRIPGNAFQNLIFEK